VLIQRNLTVIGSLGGDHRRLRGRAGVHRALQRPLRVGPA